MRPCFLSLALTLFAAHARSQNAISRGYVVRDGDTLHGQLKIDRQRNLMHEVSFLQDGQKDFAVLTPSDLSAFGYDDGPLYRSISFVNKTGPEPVAETLFGQTLVSGKYSLYSIDEDGDIYYVVKKDTATWLLYDDKFPVSGLEVIPGNYKNQLMFFSAGCDGLNANEVPYSAKALTAFMLRVNECQAPGIASSAYYVKSRWEAHYFLYAGGLPTNNNGQTTLDATVRLVNPRFDPRASLNIGLHYSSTANITETGSSLFAAATSPNITVEDSTGMPTLHLLSIPVTLQYNLLMGRIQPAVYIGFSAAYMSVDPPALGSGQTFSIAVIGGACIEGYITKHLFIKADWRYELLVQNLSIGVGFKF